jgi:membrane protein
MNLRRTGIMVFLWLLKRAIVRAMEQNCFGSAKAAAYSGLLAMFPMLTATAAILVQIRAEDVSRLISRYLFTVVPPGTEELILERFVVGGERPLWPLVVATVLALYAGSGLMISLMEGFNAAYRTKSTRSFLRTRLVAAQLVLITAVPAVMASALMLLGRRTERRIIQWLSGSVPGEQLSRGLLLLGGATRIAIALGTIILVTMLLYHIGPERRQRWRELWPGALLATFLWGLAAAGFGWYVGNIADYNVMYGSVGAVIALCVWMYLMAIIAMIGCAFNAELELWRGFRRRRRLAERVETKA